MEVLFGLAILYLWRDDLKAWCSDTIALGIKKSKLPDEVKDEEVK